MDQSPGAKRRRAAKFGEQASKHPRSNGLAKLPPKANSDVTVASSSKTVPLRHGRPFVPRYDRPNTRAHNSSETGSDALQSDDVAPEATESGSKVPSSPQTEELGSDKEQSPTAQLNATANPSEVNPPTTPPAKTASQIAESDVRSLEALRLSLQGARARAALERVNSFDSENILHEAQSTHQDTPSTPTPIRNTPKELLAMDKPVLIPAQIAVVTGSPSKRVAFSPNKQESRLSIPNKPPPTPTKLKGILKPPTMRGDDGLDSDHGLEAGDEAPTAQRSRPISRIDGVEEGEQFVKAAMAALESPDNSVRSGAYVTLLAKLRTCEERQHMSEIRETIRKSGIFFKRDLVVTSPSNLVQAALKCLGYYLFSEAIVVLFSGKEIETFLLAIMNLIATTADKATCHQATWCLSTQRIPSKFLAPFIPQLVRVFVDNLDSRFKSLSIMSESLLAIFAILSRHPSEILPHVDVWLIPVILRLVHSIPGIRSKALDILNMSIPKLIEKDDPRRYQVVNTFLSNNCTDFFGLLGQNFLEVGDEVYAITVWGVLVTIFGKSLQKSHQLNPLLKMAEKCFNTSSPRRSEIKMAAFQAWTRLIYIFSIGNHVSQEKPLRLMLTPIKNSLMNERHKRVRLACTNTWISLLYALGPRMPKVASEVFFPLLQTVLKDESEHVRDLGLRLLNAVFSNAGGQDLIEGRECIVPGTISLSDPSWSDPTWVRTELIDQGLEGLYATLNIQSRITDATREEWQLSGLTGLPLLTQPFARVWESIVRVVRDINQNEKEIKPSAESERAISCLLQFVEKVSRCNPPGLIPTDWPDSELQGAKVLKRDAQEAGYILRADIVHYLYVCIIEIFSVRSLVGARYRIEDSCFSTVARTSTVSPLEFTLKCWLAMGESIVGSPFETSYWQAVATLVDMSKSGLHALGALYKCLNHMNDIQDRWTAREELNWANPREHAPPRVFSEFRCKYWSIIAQRLGGTMNEMNEISEDTTGGDEGGYAELFGLLAYPLAILIPGPLKDGSEEIQEHGQYANQFKAIFLPTWTDLTRVFYKVAQHKRGNANIAVNTLARHIQMSFSALDPFESTPTMVLACATVIVDTMVLSDPKTSSQISRAKSPFGKSLPYLDHNRDFENILLLCGYLFAKAYTSLETSLDKGSNHVPQGQAAAFLLVEKLMNKAPRSLVISWLHTLQDSIIVWMGDSNQFIRYISSKDVRKQYDVKIETLWCDCILKRLLSLSQDASKDVTRTSFGTVMTPHLATIRGALQAQEDAVGGDLTLVSNSKRKEGEEAFTSKSLALLAPLLVVGLGSERKAIVNKTLECWNQTFGLSKTPLDYPEEIALVMKSLRLVATIQLPGWPYEDDSQTELPQFNEGGSQSQEMLSLPTELASRSGLSRLLKQKAELTAQCSPKKKARKIPGLVVESRSESREGSVSGTPPQSPGGNTMGVRIPLPQAAIDSDSSVQSNGSRRSRKRKPKTVHSLSMDPVKKTLVAQSAECNSTPEGSDDEMEIVTPSKKPKRIQVKKEQLPAAPVWRLKSPMKPYDPAERDHGASSPAAESPFDETGHMSIDSSSNVSPHATSHGSSGPETQISSASAEEVPLEAATLPVTTASGFDLDASHDMLEARKRSAASQDVEQGGGAEMMDNHQSLTGQEYFSATSDPTRSIPAVENGGDRAELTEVSNSLRSSQEESGSPTSTSLRVVPDHGQDQPTRSKANPSQPFSPDADVPTQEMRPTMTTTATGPIATGEEFRMSMSRIVEARSVLGGMNMRQLHELQNQLMVLNQAVVGVWGQLMSEEKEKEREEQGRSLLL